MLIDLVLADTVTKLDERCAGTVLVAASHGGTYSAYLAAKSHARAVILNDAGIGKDAAGIAGLQLLDGLGVPAATVSHFSARIGDAKDMVRRGTISRVNKAASELHCTPGQDVLTCVQRMHAASKTDYSVPSYGESRFVLEQADDELQIFGLDSVSLLRPDDAGHVVISASHGGTIDGRANVGPDVLAIAFNDAGVGVDGAGVASLRLLDERGIPAVAVDAYTSRIGDARSAYESGIVSHANDRAREAGVRVGGTVREFALAIAAARGQHPVRN